MLKSLTGVKTVAMEMGRREHFKILRNAFQVHISSKTPKLSVPQIQPGFITEIFGSTKFRNTIASVYYWYSPETPVAPSYKNRMEAITPPPPSCI